MQAVHNLSVGDRCVMVRRSGFADRPSTAELVHIDPPQVWRIREIDGPNRATVTSRSPSWPPTVPHASPAMHARRSCGDAVKGDHDQWPSLNNRPVLGELDHRRASVPGDTVMAAWHQSSL